MSIDVFHKKNYAFNLKIFLPIFKNININTICILITDEKEMIIMKRIFITVLCIFFLGHIYAFENEMDMAKSFAVPEWTYEGIEVLKAHYPMNSKFDSHISKYTFSRIEFGSVLYEFVTDIFYDIKGFDYGPYTYKDMEMISKMIIEFQDELTPPKQKDIQKLADSIKNVSFVTQKLKNKLFANSYHHFPEKQLNEVVCMPEHKVAKMYEDYRKKKIRQQLVVAKDPENARDFVAKYLNEGIIAFRLKNYELAMLKLKLAYTKMPNNPVIHLWIARIFCVKGYFQKAIERWEKIISLVDTNIVLREYRIHTDVMDVITEAEQVVNAFPDSSVARYFLGTLYLRNTKQHERAVEEFKKVVALEQKNMEIN